MHQEWLFVKIISQGFRGNPVFSGKIKMLLYRFSKCVIMNLPYRDTL